jgi:4-carboxymuconolactone decarboxylase
MKTFKKLIICLLLFVGFKATAQKQTTIQRAPGDNMTGAVWIEVLSSADSIFNYQIANVTFEPRARTNWHKHPGGQVLLVVEGIGYYQEKGKSIQLLHKGDIVKCYPNVEHWHGASPDSKFTHTGITPETTKGRVVWLAKVTEQEYNRYK